MFPLRFDLDVLNYINMYIHLRAHTQEQRHQCSKSVGLSQTKDGVNDFEDGVSGDFKSANIASIFTFGFIESLICN